MVKEQIKSMKDERNESLEKHQQDMIRFEEERRRFEGEISILRKENAVLKAENEVLERQRKEAMEQQFAASNAQRESAGSKLNQTIEQVLQLTGSCTALQIQNSKLTQELAVAKGDILNKNRDIERLTKQFEDATKDLDEVKIKYGDLRADYANLELKKNMWTKERERMEKHLNKGQRDLDKVRTQKDDLKENCIKMEHQLEQQKLQIDNLHDQLDEQMAPPPEFNIFPPTEHKEEEDELSPLPKIDKNNFKKSTLETSFEHLMTQILTDRERMSKEEQELRSELDINYPLSPDDS
jgi:chromosome segregation ATPase